MNDLGHYPHGCGIPWVDRMDKGNLEEKVRQIHGEVSAADHTESNSKYEDAMKRAAGSYLQGGKIYDRETGIFINL